MEILQNIWFQIALGLLPAVILSLILLFVKKVGRMAYITLTVGITVLFAGSCWLGVNQLLAPEEETTVKTVQAREEISKEELIAIAYSFACNDDIDNALRVVDTYSDIYGYDDNCTLITARINVLRGRYEAAWGAYRKLYAGNLPAEAQAVEKIVLSTRVDMVLADRLAESGYEQVMAFSAEEIYQLQNGGARELVLELIEKESIDKTLESGVKWVIRVNTFFDAFLEEEGYDEGLLDDLVDETEEFETHAVLQKLEVFREARLKILLIDGEFDDIISYLDEYAGCTEYMTALELYINDLTDKEDISEALGLEMIDGIENLTAQLSSILEDGRGKLSDTDIHTLEDQIAMLKSYREDMALYTIEDNLRDAVVDPDNYRVSSKIYMALSKVCKMRKDTVRSNQYFSEALLAAPGSDDSEYSNAMRELSQVIAGEGGDELLKKIPENSQKAVENSYIIPGTGKLIRNNNAEAEIMEQVQEQTIKYSAAVTINSVDVSNFETVVLKVQISDEMITEREIKNLIRLNDCNYDIENFTIEKVEYENANIILCCDNSGSMSGSVNSLKNAVSKFLEDSHEKEVIGFYTFDDKILQSLPLGTASEAELEAAINSMGAYGGTSIYNTLTSILSSAKYDSDANQVIILMTDGQDGNNPSQGDIYENIGEVAARKGYVVYVLGMGSSINSDYLSSIASSAGGRFIYAPSDSQLDSLYQFIHGTLQDQYRITFTAKDTLTSHGRKVTVALDQKNIQNWKTYSVTDEDAKNATVDFDQGVTVHGLRERLVYRQKGQIEIFVTGTGFTASDYMTLTFSGERTYSVRASYISGTEFRAYLPEDIPEGEYDMEVFLSGRRALYLSELIVVQGEPDEIIFGGYHFTAYKIEETGSGFDLSRMVIMNNWLHFNGKISLRGQLEDTEMTLTDYSGSYVNYNDVGDTHGYATELKNKGRVLQIPALGSLTIYNAAASGESYPTEEHDIPLMEFLDLLNVNHPKLRLYPDRITMFIGSGETKLPLQDFFVSLRNESISLFETDFNITGTITGRNIDISGEASLGFLDAETVTNVLTVDFLGMRSQAEKDVLAFEFDTLKSFYKLGFNVKIPVFDAWVGASFWLENGGFDGFEVRVDTDVTITLYSVPITLSDFKFGADNFSSEKLTVAPQDIYACKLYGGFEAAAYKVSAIFEPLEAYVGDMSLLSVEATASVDLGKYFIYNLIGNAKLSMLDLIELAEIEMKVGEFKHSDVLLGMDEDEVIGFSFSVKKGIKIDIHNFYMDFNGSTSEFIITNKFSGYRHSGGVDMVLDWWIFEKEIHKDGKTTVGFYTNNGVTQFTVRSYEESNGKRKGVLFYITDEGDMDCDLSYKY